jgi:hypothetical protein
LKATRSFEREARSRSVLNVANELRASLRGDGGECFINTGVQLRLVVVGTELRGVHAEVVFRCVEQPFHRIQVRGISGKGEDNDSVGVEVGDEVRVAVDRSSIQAEN